MLEGGRTRTRWLLELRLREQILSCCQLCLLCGATGQTSNLLQTLFLYWLLWQNISSYHQGLWPQKASEESVFFKGKNNKSVLHIISMDLFREWCGRWGGKHFQPVCRVEIERMLEGCCSQGPWHAEERDWQGPCEVATKALGEFCICGGVAPFSIKGWALTEWKAALQKRTWGSSQTSWTWVNSVTLWWRRPPHTELYWKITASNQKEMIILFHSAFLRPHLKHWVQFASKRKTLTYWTKARGGLSKQLAYWRTRCARRSW